MGFIVSVGLLLAGYTLIDWGHYVASGHKVSMWYLISGKTAQETQANKDWATARTIDPNFVKGLGILDPTATYEKARAAANKVAKSTGAPGLPPTVSQDVLAGMAQLSSGWGA